jgi:acyl-CoA dehydrogenase
MESTDNATGDLLRETAERLFQQHCEPAVLRGAEAGTWPDAAWQAVVEAGFDLALVPESAGGFGVAIPDALGILRVAAAHALPLPLPETMLANWLLAQAGLALPGGVLTIAPVVPDVPLTLRQDGDGWRIGGTATRVPWGRNAAAAVVLAEAADGPRIALAPASSWRCEAGENVAREPRDTLRFDGEVTAAGATKLHVDDIRALGAALRSQQMAGALVRLTAMTTQYAQDRVQFGRPIGKFQAIQQNLAILAGQAAAAAAAADLAAEAVRDGIRLLPIAAGKARTGEAAGIGAGIAHQVHGAIGFTHEHSLHFLTRRLWSWRDEFGNEATWNRLIGHHMAAVGADRLWAELVAA